MTRPLLSWAIVGLFCLLTGQVHAFPHFGFLVESADHAESYAVRRLAETDDSIRFELRAGDCAKHFDCQTYRERIEIKEAWRPPLNKTVWYRFNLKLPEDYPEMSPKQILGQWHDGARPALSNRYENGKFWLDLMSGGHKTTHRFPVASFAKGEWNEFVYAIRWSDDGEGRLQAWINGELITDFKGPTLSADWTKPPRFKIGIYRSHLDRLDTPAPTQIAFAKQYSRSVEDNLTTLASNR